MLTVGEGLLRGPLQHWLEALCKEGPDGWHTDRAW